MAQNRELHRLTGHDKLNKTSRNLTQCHLIVQQPNTTVFTCFTVSQYQSVPTHVPWCPCFRFCHCSTYLMIMSHDRMRPRGKSSSNESSPWSELQFAPLLHWNAKSASTGNHHHHSEPSRQPGWARGENISSSSFKVLLMGLKYICSPLRRVGLCTSPQLGAWATCLDIYCLGNLPDYLLFLFQNTFYSVHIYISPLRRVGLCTSPQLGAWATCLASWPNSSSGPWTTWRRRCQSKTDTNWSANKTFLTELNFCNFSGGRGRSFDASCFGGQELPRICWQLASCWQHG